ncbi:MAG: hypothetical protein VX681_00990 [Myxococcota bacterium]|nr:hypothetical protein [Myxococcota bacterium]
MPDDARTTQTTYDESAPAFLARTRDSAHGRKWPERFVARLSVAGVEPAVEVMRSVVWLAR